MVARAPSGDGGGPLGERPGHRHRPRRSAARLFEPFVRGREAGERAPRGLGLGLLHHARRSCAATAGGIEVESEPGRGSRFTVVLPFERPR